MDVSKDLEDKSAGTFETSESLSLETRCHIPENLNL